MGEKIIKLERLAKKGMKMSIRIPDIQTWLKMTKADPAIPRSFRQLRRLERLIFRVRRRKPVRPMRPIGRIRGVVIGLFEECGESLYYRFFAGLGNPFLTATQRAIIEADIDADTPDLEQSIETDHFILRWTNQSPLASDNIADQTIIEETGEYLETAWERYNTVFGKAPYVPAGNAKIEVNFYYLGSGTYGVASPPDGPIVFNSHYWVNEPGIRQPVSAHELFHKLQYAFGYRTKHIPSGSYKWFSEGTAS